jgi:hypothetical protein
VTGRCAGAAQSRLLRPDPVLPLSGAHTGAVLPGDLIDAVAAALEREALEPDMGVRSELLLRVRQVVDTWLSGALTTEEAIEVLATPEEPGSGVNLRPTLPADH